MTSAREETNDIELILSVLRLAQDPGYVLVGPAERAWRRRVHGGRDLDHARAYEDAAVHQLLAQKLLRIGASTQMRRGGYEGRARLVIVPKTTELMTQRWRNHTPAR